MGSCPTTTWHNNDRQWMFSLDSRVHIEPGPNRNMSRGSPAAPARRRCHRCRWSCRRWCRCSRRHRRGRGTRGELGGVHTSTHPTDASYHGRPRSCATWAVRCSTARSARRPTTVLHIVNHGADDQPTPHVEHDIELHEAAPHHGARVVLRGPGPTTSVNANSSRPRSPPRSGATTGPRRRRAGHAGVRTQRPRLVLAPRRGRRVAGRAGVCWPR